MDQHLKRGIGGSLSVGVALVTSLSLAMPAMAGDWEDDGGRWGDSSWDDESWQDSRHDGSWEDGPAPVAQTVVDGLAAPLLGLAVGDRRTLYTSQSFAGILTKVKGQGRTTDAATYPGQAVTGVDVGKRGTVTYLVTRSDPTAPPVGLVMRMKRDGSTTQLADVAAYEAQNNPDSGNTYGFLNLTQECKDAFPADPPQDYPSPEPYTGQVDSNAYAVAVLPKGGVVVADAGGNDLVYVSRSGMLRTLAVLPPRPVTVTKEMLSAIGPVPLPDCAEGATFAFEPVPTDVEVGEDGMLYVTSLPGGPEGNPAFGGRGSVFRVNPWNGSIKEVATGFDGAVDLALDDDCTIYVAEMFGGAISKVTSNGPVKVIDLPFPGALEYANGKLYATTSELFFGPPVPASIVRFRV